MFKTKKLKQLSKYNYLGIILFFIYLSMAILIFIFLMLLTEPKESVRLPEAKERIWFLECQSNNTETCNTIAEESIKAGVNPQLMLDLAWGESSLNPNIVGDDKYHSRGLYQISSFYHPEVSDEVVFSIKKSTRWTAQRIKSGFGCEWTVYKYLTNKCL